MSCVMNKALFNSHSRGCILVPLKKAAFHLLIPGIYYLHKRFRNSTKNVNCSKFYILSFKQNGEQNLYYYCQYVLEAVNENLLHLPNQSLPPSSVTMSTCPLSPILILIK